MKSVNNYVFGAMMLTIAVIVLQFICAVTKPPIKKPHRSEKPPGWDKQPVRPLSDTVARIPANWQEGCIVSEPSGVVYIYWVDETDKVVRRLIQKSNRSIQVKAEDNSITIATSEDETR